MHFYLGFDFLLSHPIYLLSALAVALLVYQISLSIYNVYFHPLAVYPGPKLHCASILPQVIHMTSGNLAQHYVKLHEQYGEVVRVSPTELSYIAGYAWTDVYGIRQGHEEMPKWRFRTGELGRNIITANRTDHQWMRRLISHAFSEKALRDQEPLIQMYVDLLVQRLKETGSKPTDLVSWYNFTTFDLIGDLAFGEPFDCLRDSSYKAWVAMIFQSIKAAVTAASTSLLLGPFFMWLLPLCLPKSLMEKRKAHVALTKEKVARRLDNNTNRPDFISYLLRPNNKKTMSYQEIEANSELLIIAGSETTATLLSGATYHLLRNPHVMQKLVEEVRSSFSSEQDITMVGVNRLHYMLAVLDEALRMYPPVPGNLKRIVPEPGDMVGEKWVPPGTSVSVCQLAAFHSKMNFKDPDAFVPERWMGDPAYANDNRSVFQPFSYGPRNCVGRNLAYAEMRLILARVLWNFDLELMPESENWTDQKIFVLWDKHPLYVKLTPA